MNACLVKGDVRFEGGKVKKNISKGKRHKLFFFSFLEIYLVFYFEFFFKICNGFFSSSVFPQMKEFALDNVLHFLFII